MYVYMIPHKIQRDRYVIHVYTYVYNYDIRICVHRYMLLCLKVGFPLFKRKPLKRSCLHLSTRACRPKEEPSKQSVRTFWLL